MQAAVRAVRLEETLARMSTWGKIRLHAKRAIVHVICAFIIAGLLFAVMKIADISWRVNTNQSF